MPPPFACSHPLVRLPPSTCSRPLGSGPVAASTCRCRFWGPINNFVCFGASSDRSASPNLTSPCFTDRLPRSMAGRFVTQRLASWVCRARSSHLGPQAFASLRTGAPVNPTASELGIRTFSNRFHGASVDYVARFLSLFPRSIAGSKMICPTTTMPSIIITRMKPRTFGSLGGAKQPFSPDASKRSEYFKQHEIWMAEQKAKLAASQAKNAALFADMDRKKNRRFQKVYESTDIFVVFYMGLLDLWGNSL
ncbi:hypothetical protein ACP4OV_018011 [Aristida adscensionis]